jgi:hypothetical protein
VAEICASKVGKGHDLFPASEQSLRDSVYSKRVVDTHRHSERSFRDDTIKISVREESLIEKKHSVLSRFIGFPELHRTNILLRKTSPSGNHHNVFVSKKKERQAITPAPR